MAESQKVKKERAAQIVARLEEKYPEAVCSLAWVGDPWRLLIMGRLSAQCTDERVNIVSEELFRVCPDAAAMASCELPVLERLIFSCGLYKTKAKSIKEMSAMIGTRFEGRVPDTMEELLTLPGVGRKIANLILGDVYHLPAVVADTHCIRISARLGLCGKGGEKTTPEKTEAELSRLIAGEKQSDFCHRLVLFGREICTARAPRCGDCPLHDLCKYPAVKSEDAS